MTSDLVAQVRDVAGRISDVDDHTTLHLAADRIEALEREVALLYDDKAHDADAIKAGRELVQALERERQWRPIEDAPKDGTVFIGGAPGRASAETYWCGEWCNSPDYQPTHFLPLPTPPSDSHD